MYREKMVKMTINWQLWKKPETGGILVSLTCFVTICLFLFIKTLTHFEYTQSEIKNTLVKMQVLNKQIEEVAAYEKLQQQEMQKFTNFKKKKWNTPLTQELLNQVLYDLQKQTNVEFLFIQPKTGKGENKATITLLVKVMRDQSFFNFLQKIETELPGIVKIKHFELKRTSELNSQLAKKVSEGEKISLFEGTIEFEIEQT